MKLHFKLDHSKSPRFKAMVRIYTILNSNETNINHCVVTCVVHLVPDFGLDL